MKDDVKLSTEIKEKAQAIVWSDNTYEEKEVMFNQLLIQAITSEREKAVAEEITGETSDGYHTFNELYEYRLLYNANLFNEWASQNKYFVHKSKKHHDGEECFGGGWFIVMATTPKGQISNHYEMKDWDLFRCEERARADKWDGHTPKDVAETLRKLSLTPKEKESE